MAIRYADGSRTVTNEEVRLTAAKAANGFASLGVGQGDAIALMLRNDVALFEASFAAAQLGAFVVPINWHLQGDETRYILLDCGAKILVIHEDLYEIVGSFIPSNIVVRLVRTPAMIEQVYRLPARKRTATAATLDWDAWVDDFSPSSISDRVSPGNIVYTSGTTGRPKGVRRDGLTAEEIDARNRALAKGYGLKRGMRAIITGPMYHGSTNGHGLGVVRYDGDAVLMPRFDAEDLLRLIESHKAQNLTLVPTMFVRLVALPEAVRARYDVSSLEFVSHGAAPCPVEVKHRMIEWFGPIISEFYGSTELSGVSSIDSYEWLEKPGSVGRPHVPIKIVGAKGELGLGGGVGDILVKPAFKFAYHNSPGRAEADGDGYISTGDIGYLDSDGYLFICDRKTDMVISGGVNIYPAEIEAVLLQMPGVRDCAVFGVPDAEMGESLAAAVEVEPGFPPMTAEDIRGWVRERLAGYKAPKLVEFHAELPRHDTGKIFKNELRRPHWADAGRQI